MEEIDLPRYWGGGTASILYDLEGKQIKAYVDEFGTIKNKYGDLLGDLVAIEDHDAMGVIVTDQPRMVRSIADWDFGDTGWLDNKVPITFQFGYVHEGEQYAVVNVKWAWKKTVWGKLGPDDELEGDDLKLVHLSSMVVHIGNLSHEKQS